jgi:hypothetical protein
MFHLVSQISLTLRLSLIVSEFMRRFCGSRVRVHVGDLVSFEQLKNPNNGKLLTAELYGLVHALAPNAQMASRNRPADSKVAVGVSRRSSL